MKQLRVVQNFEEMPEEILKAVDDMIVGKPGLIGLTAQVWKDLPAQWKDDYRHYVLGKYLDQKAEQTGAELLRIEQLRGLRDSLFPGVFG